MPPYAALRPYDEPYWIDEAGGQVSGLALGRVRLLHHMLRGEGGQWLLCNQRCLAQVVGFVTRGHDV